MLVISINGVKKKLRLLTKILVGLVALFLIVYAFNAALPASGEAPIIITDNNSDDENGSHYPGEPIRVYNNLENYLQDKITGVQDPN